MELWVGRHHSGASHSPPHLTPRRPRRKVQRTPFHVSRKLHTFWWASASLAVASPLTVARRGPMLLPMTRDERAEMTTMTPAARRVLEQACAKMGLESEGWEHYLTGMGDAGGTFHYDRPDGRVLVVNTTEQGVEIDHERSVIFGVEPCTCRAVVDGGPVPCAVHGGQYAKAWARGLRGTAYTTRHPDGEPRDVYSGERLEL